MLTNDAIRTSPDIRLYSDELISVKSIDDNETYWFSKRGLPWGTRENSSFLSHRNYGKSAAQKVFTVWPKKSQYLKKTSSPRFMHTLVISSNFRIL